MPPDARSVSGVHATSSGSRAPREPVFNLVTPRSRCPACQAPVHAWQNIPVLSYLLLRGRCAACGAQISFRYPLVELVTGVLSAIVAARFGFSWPLLAALVFTWSLIGLSGIDLDHQLLPDSITLPLLWLGLLVSLGHGGGTHFSIPADPRYGVVPAMFWGAFGKDGFVDERLSPGEVRKVECRFSEASESEVPTVEVQVVHRRGDFGISPANAPWKVKPYDPPPQTLWTRIVR